MNLFFQSLTGQKNELILYSEFSIKKVKIINDLVLGIPYKSQRYIYSGKCFENNRTLSDYNTGNFGDIIHYVIRDDKNYFKNYFNLYDYDIYSLIKNQKINGLWEVNDENIRLLKNFGDSFSYFYQILKDKYTINDKEIVFSIFVISFLNSFHYKKRYKYIFEKAFNILTKNINDYDMKKQKEFEKLIIE